MEEILHHLIGSSSHYIFAEMFTIRVVQDVFHQQYEWLLSNGNIHYIILNLHIKQETQKAKKLRFWHFHAKLLLTIAVHDIQSCYILTFTIQLSSAPFFKLFWFVCLSEVFKNTKNKNKKTPSALKQKSYDSWWIVRHNSYKSCQATCTLLCRTTGPSLCDAIGHLNAQSS